MRDGTTIRQPVSAAYGGGGLFGIGFTLGIAEALVDDGADLASVPSIGTTAGSWAAGALALGIRFEHAMDLVGHRVPRVPDPRPGRLYELAAEVFGEDTRAPTVRVGVCALPRLQHRLLSGADHPIADLVTASSSVPAMLAPHRIGRTRYVDGGVRSMAAIDHAAPAALLLVVLPLSGPMFGPAGRLIERGIRRELRTWRTANPHAEALVVRPDARIARLARRPDQLFDPDLALRCYDLAYGEGRRLREEWHVMARDAADDAAA
jgi:hypothetical protein